MKHKENINFLKYEKKNIFTDFKYRENLKTNFVEQVKFNFVSDGANPKLKKKFYKNTNIGVMHINNKEDYLKLNEYGNLDTIEDLNNENNFREDISKSLNREDYYDFSREEMQYEIFKLKIKNLDIDLQKILIKSFKKLRILFTGSLFQKKYYRILLDNRICKSMHLDELKIPTKKLALALAEEWESQKDIVNLYKMHLVIF